MVDSYFLQVLEHFNLWIKPCTIEYACIHTHTCRNAGTLAHRLTHLHTGTVLSLNQITPACAHWSNNVSDMASFLQNWLGKHSPSHPDPVFLGLRPEYRNREGHRFRNQNQRWVDLQPVVESRGTHLWEDGRHKMDLSQRNKHPAVGAKTQRCNQSAPSSH